MKEKRDKNGNDKSKIEELNKTLKNRNCTINQHSSIMEITFKNAEDADWFENIFEHYQGESAVSCLMSMRPRGEHARHKFVFNVKYLDKFIQLLKEG